MPIKQIHFGFHIYAHNKTKRFHDRRRNWSWALQNAGLNPIDRTSGIRRCVIARFLRLCIFAWSWAEASKGLYRFDCAETLRQQSALYADRSATAFRESHRDAINEVTLDGSICGGTSFLGFLKIFWWKLFQTPFLSLRAKKVTTKPQKHFRHRRKKCASTPTIYLNIVGSKSFTKVRVDLQPTFYWTQAFFFKPI